MILYSMIFNNSGNLLVEYYNKDSAGKKYASELQTLLKDSVNAELPQIKDTIELEDGNAIHRLSEQEYQFICITSIEIGRKVPFSFLQELREAFNACPDDFNVDMLRLKMDKFSESADVVKHVQTELAQVKDLMFQNIEKVLDRGEKIEILVNKTDHLNQAAFRFKKRTNAIKRQLWWRNSKLLIVLLYLIASMICDFNLSKCMN